MRTAVQARFFGRLTRGYQSSQHGVLERLVR